MKTLFALALLPSLALAAAYQPQSGPYPTTAPTYKVPRAAQTYEPSQLGGYDEKARASFSQGDTDGAAFALEQSLEVNPFDPVALNNLAVVKVEQGDYFAAQELLARASNLAPNNTEVAANLARLRSFVQTYAISQESPTGVLPNPADSPAYPQGLPPAPPALWTRPAR